MATSLIGGLLGNDWAADRICVADPAPQSRQRVTRRFGVAAHADNSKVVENSDIIILAVKPQMMKDALTPLAVTLQQHKPLLVSIAAGIRLRSIENWGGGQLPTVRAMPNTPALVGAGATGLFANPAVSDAQREAAESILRAVGTTVWLGDESQLDTVTALSGSGPAYFFYLMEAMQQAGIDLGLEADTARLLTLETALGAARLALQEQESFAELRRRVTSPGGTTESAIAAFDAAATRDTVIAAVDAARRRSEELAKLLDDF
jgi:pyrroline-5-carboxylate reductase